MENRPGYLRLFVYGVAIALLTLLAYSNAIPPLFAGLDAKESVRDNPYIRTLWPLSHAMSLPLLEDTLAADEGSKGGTMVRRPILSLSFAINRALLGPEPASFHLVNIAIHVGTALLLFALVRFTLSLPAVAPRIAPRAAGLAFASALLWALHPLQTESVTNLVQRAESLMGLLYLSTLYCAARAMTATAHGRLWAMAAVVACALGMGTKETMVTAPVAVLLYDWVFVARSGRDLAGRWRLHSALLLTWTVLVVLIATTAHDAARDFDDGKTLPYLLAQPRIILHYLRLVFWPDELHVYVNTRAFVFTIGLTPVREFVAPALLLSAAFIGAAVAAWKRNGLGFLGLCFFLILAPTSSVVATSDVLQEHRLYLSLASVLVFVVLAADRLAARRRVVAVAMLVAAAVALGARSYARNDDYHSEFGMYYPDDMRQAVIIVARHEFAQGNIAQALELFDQALAQFPDDNSRGEAHYDLGNLFLQRGFAAEAQRHFIQAIEANSALAAAHNNLGVLLAVEGDLDGAEHHLRAAIEYNPRHYLAMMTLANIYGSTHREAEAIAMFGRVLDLIPQLEAPGKAVALLLARGTDPAIPPLEIDLTIRLAPGYSDAYLMQRPPPFREPQ